MNGMEDAGAERRRRAIRRATLYSWGFLFAALLATVGGGALVAWLLALTGMPFLVTWIVLMLVILVPSLLALAWRGVKERIGGPGPSPGKGIGADDGG
jgi:hypothetical protein